MSFSDDDGDLGVSPKKTPPILDYHALVAATVNFYWIIPVAMAIALVAALSFLRFAVPVYRSSAEIKVEHRAVSQGLSLTGNASLAEEAITFEDLQTFEHGFLNFELMDRVITALNLEKRSNFVAPNRPASTVSHGELMGYLMGNSRVSLVSGTRLIEISFDNWDPATAREVTTALVEQGVQYDRDQRIKALGDNVKYLEDEVKNSEHALTASEEKQTDYIKNLGNISIDEESNLISMQLREVNSNYTAARANRMKLESDYSQIEKYRNDAGNLISIPSIQNAPSVQELTNRINDLRGNLAKLAQRYRPANPFIIQAQTELAALEQARTKEVLKAPEGVRISLDTARRNEDSIEQEQTELEKKAINVKELAIQSQVYQRQIDANKLTYETALKMLNEELSQTRSQPVLLQIVAPATPAIRSTLQPRKVLAGSAAGGLLFGVAVIVLIARLNSSVKSAEDAEALLKLSALATVPVYVPEKEEKGATPSTDWPTGFAKDYCPVLTDIDPHVSEAFRTLSTFLQVTEEGEKSSLILLTSSHAGEGVSFCCLNLGVSLAQAGQRTLLVDANLRNPSQEQRLMGANGHYGLSDYLQGHGSFSSIVRSTPVKNLDLVPAGSRSRHPAEILSRPRFRQFLEEARMFYDRVIFDSASLAVVSDTLCFARFIPLVCLVIRINKTSESSATRSLELLHRSEARVAGLVTNFASRSAHETYTEDGLLIPVDPDDHTRGFPAKCASCGRIYNSPEEYIEKTLPVEDSLEGRSRNGASKTDSYIRKCVCGTSVILPTVTRRDTSAAGVERRQLFGRLLEELTRGGLPREDARTKLLLALKIWRNEISNDDATGGSQAALRRRALFDELKDALEGAGFSREDANSRLLNAAQLWREYP